MKKYLNKTLLIFLLSVSLRSVAFFPSIKENRARSAYDFLNSMGVCSSITGRGEAIEGTIASMKYTGLRFIRCGLEDGISTEDMIRLHNETGVRIVYGLLSGGTNISRLIKESRELALAGALLAIEGNNEPNNWGITYEGEQGGEYKSWVPVAKLQRDLYQAVKNDSVLKDYPVWSISENGAQTDNAGLQFLIVPEGAGTIMPAGTRFADFANCHNYITHPSWPGLHNNQTWRSADPGPDCPVDGLYGNYGKTWRNKFSGYSEKELLNLPRVTTETGIAVNEFVTEEVQARLFLNLYLSQFKRGWKYTSIYLLRTRSNEPAHEAYAMFKMNYAPKQAAHYLHNFTSILDDDEPFKKTGNMRYEISDQPETVHDLLLQKSNGKFYLVIWGERFRGGTDNVRVELDKKYREVNIYKPTAGKSPVQTFYNTDNILLELSNHPLIVEL